MIVSYNLLEAFISERLDEIAGHVNGGVVHFSDLPERLQKAATSDVVKVANSRVQRGGWDLASAVAFTTDVGQCLAASSGQLKLSSLTWQWTGSNMAAEDVNKMMRLFHVSSPWVTIGKLSERTGATIPDPHTTLVGLMRERNYCAHKSAHQVSNLLIRAVPHQIQVIGMGIDISISVAAHEMHIGKREFLDDSNWMSPARIKFRFIDKRGNKWAELLEDSSRATHVNINKDLLIKNAVNTARGKYQIVIVRDHARQVVDWIYPDLS